MRKLSHLFVCLVAAAATACIELPATPTVSPLEQCYRSANRDIEMAQSSVEVALADLNRGYRVETKTRDSYCPNFDLRDKKGDNRAIVTPCKKTKEVRIDVPRQQLEDAYARAQKRYDTAIKLSKTRCTGFAPTPEPSPVVPAPAK